MLWGFWTLLTSVPDLVYKGSKRQRFVDLQFCLSLVGGSVAVVDGFIIDIDINITLHGGIIISGCHHVLIKSAIMRSIYIYIPSCCRHDLVRPMFNPRLLVRSTPGFPEHKQFCHFGGWKLWSRGIKRGGCLQFSEGLENIVYHFDPFCDRGRLFFGEGWWTNSQQLIFQKGWKWMQHAVFCSLMSICVRNTNTM